jgi:hypothetical protein
LRCLRPLTIVQSRHSERTVRTPPLDARVGARGPERGADNLDAFGPEHLVERPGVLGVAIVDQDDGVIEPLVDHEVSTVKKSVASTPWAWLRRNWNQVGPDRLGAGPRPPALRVRRMVVAPNRMPSLRSSPWIRT